MCLVAGVCCDSQTSKFGMFVKYVRWVANNGVCVSAFGVVQNVVEGGGKIIVEDRPGWRGRNGKNAIPVLRSQTCP